MKVLIIGYGSIGERHARILDSHGHEVACVTRNPKCSFTTYIDVAKGITEFQPELIIISNRTIDHFDTMNEVAATGFSKRILIEKPIFNSVPPTLSRTTDNVFTAYNLRFHPMVQRTADLLQGKQSTPLASMSDNISRTGVPERITQPAIRPTSRKAAAYCETCHTNWISLSGSWVPGNASRHSEATSAPCRLIRTMYSACSSNVTDATLSAFTWITSTEFHAGDLKSTPKNSVSMRTSFQAILKSMRTGKRIDRNGT